MNLPSGFLLTLTIAFTSLLIAGCSGPASHSRGADLPTPTEHRVAMRGEALFFAGALRVETTVSRGLPRSKRGEATDEERRSGGGRRHRGGMSGAGMGRPAGSSEGERSEEGESRSMRQPQMSAPPLTLQVKLFNLSQSPLEITIRDVKSDLGDFATRPERLTIAPGQEADVDPMVSELGVVAAEIPITIGLRSSGKTETQVVVVKDTLKTSGGE